jgi:site-specific DNA recombinase
MTAVASTGEPEPWGAFVRISHARRKDPTTGRWVVETDGVDRQKPQCEALIEQHGGYLYRTYEANDRSAHKKTPPQFEEMLADAKAGRIKGIAATAQDRFTRWPRDAERLIDVAEEYGVALDTVTGKYDLSNSKDRLMFRIRAAIAADEVEEKQRRVEDWHAQRAERGEELGGGYRPFGFEPDRITHRDVEAALVRQAVDRIILEGWSIRRICRDWERRGVATTGGAKHWRTQTVRGILRSPRIAGLCERNGEFYTAKWHHIVDRETWELLQVMLSSSGRRTTPGPARVHPLAGLIHCGLCGAGLSGQTTAQGRVYRCRSGEPNFGCGGVSGPAEAIEELVRERGFDWCNSGLYDEARANAAASDDLVHQRLQEVQRAKAHLKKVKADYDAGHLDGRDYKERKAKAKERVSKAEGELTTAQSRHGLMAMLESGDDLWAAWTKGGFDYQRGFYERLVGDVKLYLSRRGSGRDFDPERVQVLPGAWAEHLSTPLAVADPPKVEPWRLPKNQRRNRILACLSELPGEPLSPTVIGEALDREPREIAEVLRKLASKGVVAQVQARSGKAASLYVLGDLDVLDDLADDQKPPRLAPELAAKLREVVEAARAARHGGWGYWRGCRCEVCVAAKSAYDHEYNRRYREEHAEELREYERTRRPPRVVKTHGYGGYTSGCRCGVCTAGQREYRARAAS